MQYWLFGWESVIFVQSWRNISKLQRAWLFFGFFLPGMNWNYEQAPHRIHKCKSLQYILAHVEARGQGQPRHGTRGLNASLQVHIGSLQSRPPASPAPAESLPLVFMYQTTDLFSLIQTAVPQSSAGLPLSIAIRHLYEERLGSEYCLNVCTFGLICSTKPQSGTHHCCHCQPTMTRPKLHLW